MWAVVCNCMWWRIEIDAVAIFQRTLRLCVRCRFWRAQMYIHTILHMIPRFFASIFVYAHNTCTIVQLYTSRCTVNRNMWEMWRVVYVCFRQLSCECMTRATRTREFNYNMTKWLSLLLPIWFGNATSTTKFISFDCTMCQKQKNISKCVKWWTNFTAFVWYLKVKFSISQTIEFFVVAKITRITLQLFTFCWNTTLSLIARKPNWHACILRLYFRSKQELNERKSMWKLFGIWALSIVIPNAWVMTMAKGDCNHKIWSETRRYDSLR